MAGWLDELCGELAPCSGTDSLEELQWKRQLLEVVMQVRYGPFLNHTSTHPLINKQQKVQETNARY